MIKYELPSIIIIEISAMVLTVLGIALGKMRDRENLKLNEEVGSIAMGTAIRGGRGAVLRIWAWASQAVCHKNWPPKKTLLPPLIDTENSIPMKTQHHLVNGSAIPLAHPIYKSLVTPLTETQLKISSQFVKFLCAKTYAESIVTNDLTENTGKEVSGMRDDSTENL